MPPEPPPVAFREALKVWARVALQSFGGPAGQIGVMHRVLVEEKRWISESRFLHALNYCMLLPGPEAQQLAIYIGWLLHRMRGGLAAGALFVLPGFVSILALSFLYAGFRSVPAVDALFFGLKPAVLAVVVEAVFRIGKRALGSPVRVLLAAAAFAGLFFFDVSFPLIVLGAGLVGWVGARLRPRWFGATEAEEARERNASPDAVDALEARGGLEHTRPSAARSAKILALGLSLWFLPLAALAILFGTGSVYVREGLFFSKTAMVTFGGAYAVLAYVAQQAVETYRWLAPGEMLDGLGMAETTPGPLIMVLQFVGFLGAYRNPGPLEPAWAGLLGSAVTTWVTFVPCFLWIFLGAPYIEKLRGNRSVQGALSAITAAVVGVILNLSIWFALHVLFESVAEEKFGWFRLFVPDWSTVSLPAFVIAAGALLAMLRFKVGMGKTLLASAVAGLWRLLMGK